MATKFKSGHTMYIEDTPKKEWLRDKFERMVRPQFNTLKNNSDLDNKKILEYGCFAGQLTEYINKNTTSKCVGIDVKILEKKENLFEYDGEKVPFDDESFDIVTCFEVIEHVLDPDQTIKEINRVLKNGGELYITAPNKYWWSFSWGHNSIEMHLRHLFKKNPDSVQLFSWWNFTGLLKKYGFTYKNLQKKPFWLSRSWLLKCIKEA